MQPVGVVADRMAPVLGIGWAPEYGGLDLDAPKYLYYQFVLFVSLPAGTKHCSYGTFLLVYR